MPETYYTPTKASGQPRRPRNQAEFRSVYIADLTRTAKANGTLSNLTNIPKLPIRRPTSRTGRKSLRKTFDADCRRLRREAGIPARTGPPIPGSEQTGHRRFYTLATMRRWGRLSGITRRDQAHVQVATDTDAPLPPNPPTSHCPPSGSVPQSGWPRGSR